MPLHMNMVGFMNENDSCGGAMEYMPLCQVMA
jgi:hypothetical protein